VRLGSLSDPRTEQRKGLVESVAFFLHFFDNSSHSYLLSLPILARPNQQRETIRPGQAKTQASQSAVDWPCLAFSLFRRLTRTLAYQLSLGPLSALFPFSFAKHEKTGPAPYTLALPCSSPSLTFLSTPHSYSILLLLLHHHSHHLTSPRRSSSTSCVACSHASTSPIHHLSDKKRSQEASR
jgi:hypothetical protein